MEQKLFSRTLYVCLFSLLAIVYIIGLFVPLMDNDSAHHADIALHMFLTGDYVSLIDNGKDYLDKPHLHFWLCALSYHVFGVTTFAYKFPSFLFTILGTYSTYRIGKSLYNAEVGKLAALIIASAFAYVLANNDVRMDAILTASIAFATWQLVDWVTTKRLVNAIGAALGLALGFCTKGHIAVFTPALGTLFYIAYKRDWKSFYHPQLLVIIGMFFLFISPVVYCYYLQYDLHPEKVVRGKSGISGVKFILWGQNIERFQGESFGSDAKNDYFFFIHSFLWAFAPWSILGYWAFINRLSSFFTRRYEWLTIGTFLVILIVISLSSFKLPHYLNITFPIMSVLVASWLMEKARRKKERSIWITQLVLCSLLVIAVLSINLWAFPITAAWKIIAAILFLLPVIFFITNKSFSAIPRAIATSAAVMAFVFFLLNANFYPRLLTYQAGEGLAAIVNREIGGSNVYFWPEVYSSSLSYYTQTIRQPFSDSLLTTGKKIWVVADKNALSQIKQQYSTGKEYHQADYEITMLQLNFINPATRKEAISTLSLVEVLGKK